MNNKKRIIKKRIGLDVKNGSKQQPIAPINELKKINDISSPSSSSKPNLLSERDIKRMGEEYTHLNKVKKITPAAGHLSARDRQRLGLEEYAPQSAAGKAGEDLATHYGKQVYRLKDSSVYVKMEDADYDVVVLISSYNRYVKLERMISQFYTQECEYKFKIILLNDGSTDERYKGLGSKFPQLQILTNTKNNGRSMYWYTVTQLWQVAKTYKTNTILMIDDDFILGENFLKLMLDCFFKVKLLNPQIVAIAPHLHSHNINNKLEQWWYNFYSIDGVGLFDVNFIKEFDYKLEPVTKEMLARVVHAHGWSQIQKKLIALNKIAYKLKYSIAYHDGNDESKMGKGLRRKSKAYTHRYVGNNKFLNADDLTY